MSYLSTRPEDVELWNGYKINYLNINNWSYTTNASDYWTPNVVYITLGIIMTMDFASITLIPTQAALSFAHSLSTATARSIDLECYLEPGVDVRLPTERTLKNANWTAYFTETVTYNDHATEQGAIGFLKYWAERQSEDNYTPETCHILVALKPEVFGTLLSALQDGRLPKTIHIEVKGLKYGWEPDGGGIVWNIEAADALPIIEVKFNVPLSAELQRPTPSDPLEIPAVSDQHPSTTHDIKSLERTFVSVLQRLKTRLTQIGISAIIAAALLLFLHH